MTAFGDNDLPLALIAWRLHAAFIEACDGFEIERQCNYRYDRPRPFWTLRCRFMDRSYLERMSRIHRRRRDLDLPIYDHLLKCSHVFNVLDWMLWRWRDGKG